MTMALGGVATGIINAHDAPMPIINTNTSGGNPSCTPIGANNGTSSAADAVFEVNSVKKIIKLAIAKITTKADAPASPDEICSAKTAEAPGNFHHLRQRNPATKQHEHAPIGIV